VTQRYIQKPTSITAKRQKDRFVKSKQVPEWVQNLAPRESMHKKGSVWVEAPGRVNLIGEHTDYNEGFVLPMTIDRYVRLVGVARHDRVVKIRSLRQAEVGEFRLGEEGDRGAGRWWDYVAGVCSKLNKHGIKLETGIDMVVDSTIPSGAGLSSSAALEAAGALALLGIHGHKVGRTKLAVICQEAENEYVGVACGVMDQMAVLKGNTGHALHIDCRSLKSVPVPLPKGLAIVVCDTKVERSLGGSEYNERRMQCEEAVDVLKKRWPDVKTLRDVTLSQVEKAADDLPPLNLQRCRHVVSENNRVGKLTKAFAKEDLEAIGSLWLESHESLRLQYEVSCPELDLMAAIGRRTVGGVASRLTGGGFGGCTVNLVAEAKAGQFAEQVMEEYKAQTGLDGEAYICQAVGGAVSGIVSGGFTND